MEGSGNLRIRFIEQHIQKQDIKRHQNRKNEHANNDLKRQTDNEDIELRHRSRQDSKTNIRQKNGKCYRHRQLHARYKYAVDKIHNETCNRRSRRQPQNRHRLKTFKQCCNQHVMPIDDEKNNNRQIIKKTSDKRYLLTGSRVHHVDHCESNLHIHDLAGKVNRRKRHIRHKADQPADKQFPRHCPCIKEYIVRRRHRAIAVYNRKQHEGKSNGSSYANAHRNVQTAEKRRDDKKPRNACQNEQIDCRMPLKQGVEIHGHISPRYPI